MVPAAGDLYIIYIMHPHLFPLMLSFWSATLFPYICQTCIMDYPFLSVLFSLALYSKQLISFFLFSEI